MRKKKSKNGRKWRRGVQAGCLALGMATAWGGEARGSMYLNIAADATQTIDNVYVLYGIGYSGQGLQSLGTLPIGHSTFALEVPDGSYRPYYTMIGLLPEGASTGVAVSFPNPVTMPASWADVFESGPISYYNRSEAEVVGYVENASNNPYPLLGFLSHYGDPTFGLDNPPLATELGQTATLVGFSAPSAVGSVTVDIGSQPLQASVPEPATWILFVGMAGSVLFWRRDLIGC